METARVTTDDNIAHTFALFPLLRKNAASPLSKGINISSNAIILVNSE